MRHILSFIIGLVISAFIVGLVGFGFALMSFDLAGGETLAEIEGQHVAGLVLSVFTLIITVFSIWQYYGRIRKYMACGLVTTQLVVMCFSIIYIINEKNISTEFDRAIWIKSDWKPEDMAKSLVKNNQLIGLTRDQVKEKLGEGAEAYGNVDSDRGSIIFKIENNWTMTILFQRDKVVSAEMRQPRLGV